MRVEIASTGDFESLVALHVLSWRSAYAGIVDEAFLANEIEPVFRAWRRDDLPSVRGSHTWVARSDAGTIVGFADAGPSRDADSGPSCAELYTLHVAPGLRGAGVGSALLSSVVDGLRKAGFLKVTAWVLESNEKARQFYEKRGWLWDGQTLSEQIGSARLSEVRYVFAPIRGGPGSVNGV